MCRSELTLIHRYMQLYKYIYIFMYIHTNLVYAIIRILMHTCNMFFGYTPPKRCGSPNHTKWLWSSRDTTTRTGACWWLSYPSLFKLFLSDINHQESASSKFYHQLSSHWMSWAIINYHQPSFSVKNTLQLSGNNSTTEPPKRGSCGKQDVVGPDRVSQRSAHAKNDTTPRCWGVHECS